MIPFSTFFKHVQWCTMILFLQVSTPRLFRQQQASTTAHLHALLHANVSANSCWDRVSAARLWMRNMRNTAETLRGSSATLNGSTAWRPWRTSVPKFSWAAGHSSKIAHNVKNWTEGRSQRCTMGLQSSSCPRLWIFVNVFENTDVDCTISAENSWRTTTLGPWPSPRMLKPNPRQSWLNTQLLPWVNAGYYLLASHICLLVFQSFPTL